MGTTSNRFGWYLAVLQLFFTLCWTVAGAALLFLGLAGLQRWAAGGRRQGA
jgi:hypothetical protein